jgi:hypothetical protein
VPPAPVTHVGRALRREVREYSSSDPSPPSRHRYRPARIPTASLVAAAVSPSRDLRSRSVRNGIPGPSGELLNLQVAQRGLHLLRRLGLISDADPEEVVSWWLGLLDTCLIDGLDLVDDPDEDEDFEDVVEAVEDALPPLLRELYSAGAATPGSFGRGRRGNGPRDPR